VLQRMGIDRATLVGHSYGGRVALQMALYDPERVADIIAIAPETHATARPLIARVVTVPVLGYALAFWSTAPALIRFGLASVCRRTGWLDGERQATYAAPLHVRGHLAAQIVQSGSAKDSDMPVPRHYPHIHVPVHLIWGENDPVFAAKDGVAMVDQMRSCDLSVIPQCGHIPHEEAFDETWAVIQQHLPSRTVILPTIR
jgi:pimeloyl-ACP methyl ester carboxylesterase